MRFIHNNEQHDRNFVHNSTLSKCNLLFCTYKMYTDRSQHLVTVNAGTYKNHGTTVYNLSFLYSSILLQPHMACISRIHTIILNYYYLTLRSNHFCNYFPYTLNKVFQLVKSPPLNIIYNDTLRCTANADSQNLKHRGKSHDI